MSDLTTRHSSTEIPYGYCHCGCGQLAPIADRNDAPRGRVKGKPLRYVRGHNGRIAIPAPVGQKVCTRCGETKPLDAFYPYRSGPRKGRRRHFCIKCFQETWTQRYADPKKRESLTKNARERRARNPQRVKEIKKATEAKYPGRHSARRAVAYRVRIGDFPPAWTMVCEICQEAQACHWHHHKGYTGDNRLNVIAVCQDCHTHEHRVEL